MTRLRPALLQAWLWGGLSSLAVHGTLVVLMARLSSRGIDKGLPLEVEIDVVEKPRPAPALSLEVTAAPRPPRQAARRRERPVVLVPPAREMPPPSVEPPRPVFGVTAESVTAGDSSMAVPLGNTVATRDRLPGRTELLGSPQPAGGGFWPEAADRIGTLPEVIDDIDAVYPLQAERDAIEGSVVLKVDVDRQGKVRGVNVLVRAGYGMDESAVRAVWRARFKPARDRNGRAVDYWVKHTVHFKPAPSEPESSP